MNETIYDKGLKQGQRTTLRRLLAKRFGPLPRVAVERLEAWPAERLDQLTDDLILADSLRELGLTDG